MKRIVAALELVHLPFTVFQSVSDCFTDSFHKFMQISPYSNQEATYIRCQIKEFCIAFALWQWLYGKKKYWGGKTWNGNPWFGNN